MTIVGVMPPSFKGETGRTDAWAPMAAYHAILPNPGRLTHNLEAIGHLKPGVSPQQADEDVRLLVARMERENPSAFGDKWSGGARPLLEATPDATLSRVFILYPDPWPKRRHNRRRVVSRQTVAELARAARPGATVRFATDIDDYAGWTLARFLDSPHFRWLAEDAENWRRPWDDWAPTRYETKARIAGRAPVYLTFVRR